MITLYAFGPAWGLPDPSPFALKAETLLKLAGQSYRIDTGGLRKAPKGKKPYLVDDGVRVPDSTFIRFHLEVKYGVDFDAGLSAEQRAVVWAVEKMCEDQLYWAMVHDRWTVEANFDKGPRKLFEVLPAPLRGPAIVYFKRRVRRDLWSQGFGRHSREEIAKLTGRAVDALATILGERSFLMGEKPCGADATVFAFLACFLKPPFDSPTRAAIQRHPGLVAYTERMMTRFFPDFAGDQFTPP